MVLTILFIQLNKIEERYIGVNQKVKTKKGRTFCIYETPGDQGTIIAAHGLTGNHKQMYHYQKALTGKYRFISYDILGRGDSDAAIKETSIFSHADDLIDLIETLEIERPILMGYSMGAYICSIVASRLPQVEALILLDGAGEADETSRQLVLPSLNRLSKVYSSEQEYIDEVKRLYRSLKVQWKDTLEDIVKYEIKKIEKGWTHKSDPDLIEQDFESFYLLNPEKVFPKVSSETLLFIATGKIAEKAPLFQESGYEKIRKLIPKIKTKYTDVNHYELVFNEQPEIVKEIEKFLAARGVK